MLETCARKGSGVGARDPGCSIAGRPCGMAERIKELRAGATHPVVVMVASWISKAGRPSIRIPVRIGAKKKRKHRTRELTPFSIRVSMSVIRCRRGAYCAGAGQVDHQFGEGGLPGGGVAGRTATADLPHLRGGLRAARAEVEGRARHPDTRPRPDPRRPAGPDRDDVRVVHLRRRRVVRRRRLLQALVRRAPARLLQVRPAIPLPAAGLAVHDGRQGLHRRLARRRPTNFPRTT